MRSRSGQISRSRVAGLVLGIAWLAGGPRPTEAAPPNPLPGTQPLDLTGDIASTLVDGAHRFLDRELTRVAAERTRTWASRHGTKAADEASSVADRERLAAILGVRDPRPGRPEFEFASSTAESACIAVAEAYRVYRVRWRAFGAVHGEGLLLRPTVASAARQAANGRASQQPPDRSAACVVALPDADQTPEQITGLAEGVPEASQFPRRLAESGCQVLVPMLIDRRVGLPKTSRLDRGKTLSHREFIYRPAFELGRHVIGYEVQKVLAAVDWLVEEATAGRETAPGQKPKIGVVGWGEGGMLALYAGALDQRIDVVGVSGYFSRRETVWQEPIERNVFGLLDRFGDAELAGLVAPRALVVEAARGPEVEVRTGTGAAPGRLTTPPVGDVRAEFARATNLVSKLHPEARFALVLSGDGTGPAWTVEAIQSVLLALGPGQTVAERGAAPRPVVADWGQATRHERQLRELDEHTQSLLTESPYVRAEFMKRLDTSSPERFQISAAGFREFFSKEVIGRFDQPLLPPIPRSRLVYDRPKWVGYEVVLDVFPDLMSYGILLLPRDLDTGAKRPVVVCQHGLEGRPRDLIEGDHPAYHDFAARLAERGYITFAPQNLYLFEDRFRSLQRKAYPLGKTLFSLIIPQHRQLTEWLKTLPGADPARIAFYGLSYGGKTAMRVPAVVTNYCLSICSADFNDWVWKNASTRSPYSYVWTGEYEIFEFDLGSTFNYAEMAALIAPRPFMVERGHFDGVAPDETVGYEFAKVRHLYAARLGLGDRCEIEWFVGPHTINGQGTFAFLDRHLNGGSPP